MSSPERQVSLPVLPLPGVPLTWSAEPRVPQRLVLRAGHSGYRFLLLRGPTTGVSPALPRARSCLSPCVWFAVLLLYRLPLPAILVLCVLNDIS